MHGVRIENNQLIYDEQLEKPTPHVGEVLIKVAYAGVNRADLFQTQGSYPPPEGVSPLPGLEISGAIAELGEGVEGFDVGQKVCALLEGGGYAEYARVAASQVLPLPKGWSLRESGGLPETLYTVWLALFHTAKVKVGEAVLIHGGASGIGSMASQMVKAVGATAITTASTPEKCAFSEAHGAVKAYSYQEGDWLEAVQVDFDKVDVVLDMVGGDYFQKNLKCLKRGGRMVSLAFLRGAKAEINMAPLLLKQIRWYGLTLRSRSREEKSILAQEIRQNCWNWLEDRDVIVPIYAEYPLSEAQKALQTLEQNLNCGKILLKA